MSSFQNMLSTCLSRALIMWRRIAALKRLTPEQADVVAHDAQALRHAHVLKAVHEALSLLPALPKPEPPRTTLSSAGLHRVGVRHLVCGCPVRILCLQVGLQGTCQPILLAPIVGETLQ